MANGRKSWLQSKATIQEQPFRSDKAAIGPLIVQFRELWNSVATKWYVRPLLQQQNRFNQLVVQQLHIQELRLIEQDRDYTALTHDLTELTAQLATANRLLDTIDDRLARLEAQLGSEKEST